MSKQVTYTAHQQKGVLLNANESSKNLLPTIRKEIQEAIFDIAFNRYPDDECTEICEAYAHYLGISSDQILAGNGSDQHLGFLIGTFLGKGKKLLTLAPDFGMYDYYASSYEADVVRFVLDPPASMDVDAFIEFGVQEKPQLVLFSNPNNPTGNYIEPLQIQEICKAFDCPVVIDEAYGEFAPESSISLLSQCENLYVTRTLSKAFGLAGARIGFLISSVENMKRLKPYHVPYSLNSISMKVGTIVLKHALEFEKEIERIKTERDAFLSKSYRFLQIAKSDANFLWIQTPHIEKLLSFFAKKGLNVRQYAHKEYCRVTIGTTEENQWIKEVLEAFEQEEALCEQEK